MQRYYAFLGGERLGPFTPEEIRQLAVDGALDRSAQLEEEESGLRLSAADAIAGLPSPDPPSAREEAAASLSPSIAAPQPAPSANLPRPSTAVMLYTAALSLLSLYLLIKRGWFFLDYVNLVIHEAGHPIFGFFGEFIKALGGTLMQLLFPALVAVHFFRRRSVYGTQFALFWFGESCLNVSVYAADARALRLDLIGGEHDWHYLLGRLDILTYDQTVAACFVTLGVLALLALAALPFLPSMRFGPVEAED